MDALSRIGNSNAHAIECEHLSRGTGFLHTLANG